MKRLCLSAWALRCLHGELPILNTYITRLSLLSVLFFFTQALAQSVAITFDDGPEMEKQAGMSAVERNDAILRQLKDSKIQSILFITLNDGDKERMGLVRKWGEEGHLIANHSVTHKSLHSKKANLNDFKMELLKCDSVISHYPGYRKLYRFPYLHEGRNLQVQDSVRAILSSASYRSAPVSIDGSDWYYNNRLLDRLKNDPETDLQPYKEAYLNHIWDRAAYYDSLSKEVLQRPIKHVLLLHHNQINALFLHDLIAMFQDKGWQFISPEAAFADSVYSTVPDFYPAYGSIIYKLARAKGINSLDRSGEDSSYEKPILDKLGL